MTSSQLLVFWLTAGRPPSLERNAQVSYMLTFVFTSLVPLQFRNWLQESKTRTFFFFFSLPLFGLAPYSIGMRGTCNNAYGS